MTLVSVMCICACEGLCTSSGSCVGQERVLDSWSWFWVAIAYTEDWTLILRKSNMSPLMDEESPFQTPFYSFRCYWKWNCLLFSILDNPSLVYTNTANLHVDFLSCNFAEFILIFVAFLEVFIYETKSSVNKQLSFFLSCVDVFAPPNCSDKDFQYFVEKKWY